MLGASRRPISRIPTLPYFAGVPGDATPARRSSRVGVAAPAAAGATARPRARARVIRTAGVRRVDIGGTVSVRATTVRQTQARARTDATGPALRGHQPTGGD